MVEYVSEALMHIIRNAVDHGIESPQEREEAGKEQKRQDYLYRGEHRRRASVIPQR